ncbi:MAG TPA: ABC transporter substrate-binding protein, partial [Jatrophihabitans sp.]
MRRRPHSEDPAAARQEAIQAHEITRRNALRFGALGMGGVGLTALLAACGTSNGGGSSSPNSGGSAPTGSGSMSTSTGPQKSGGDLVLARAQDSVDMNKTMVFSNASIWVYVQMYETLTIGSKDGRSVEPWLATKWTQSADKLTWTFTLRKGIKFHNGSPMTSKDVKFSLDKASSTKGGWEFINSAIADVSTPDDYTVVIKTKYPWAPLLADLACPSNGIVPDNYSGKSEKDFYNAPVGTGPFQWDSWDKGSKLKLKKNPDYWRAGLPYLDSVTWQVVPDDNTRNVMLQGSQAQINENPPLSTIDQIKSTQGTTVTLFPSTRTDYILMNEKRAPYDDVHVRRAVSYAIDRE